MNKNHFKKLEKEIESLRKKMLESSKNNSLSKGETLEISQKLDKLILEYTKKRSWIIFKNLKK